ncbi:Protein of unknown function [Pyronema omphalodes CBS 100304]|uniref:Uncharacterized protein n=1 Tax=Pyronema omphalodes (strain CBS 100304) TaxID=1076935 RepID=U4LIV3_PYROM|nr:Protein of unknown function [Pyronema omphalodes CBS 100304]
MKSSKQALNPNICLITQREKSKGPRPLCISGYLGEIRLGGGRLSNSISFLSWRLFCLPVCHSWHSGHHIMFRLQSDEIAAVFPAIRIYQPYFGGYIQVTFRDFSSSFLTRKVCTTSGSPT